jgi:hypothetical protein
VAEHPYATLVDLCELFADKTGHWVSRTAMCRSAAEITTTSYIDTTSINKVLALMTMNASRHGAAFALFIEKFLCP